MRNSRPDNVENAIMSVTKKLINNGHPIGMIQHTIHKQKQNKPRKNINKRTDQLVLKIPYTDNRFYKQVKRALLRNHIDARIV